LSTIPALQAATLSFDAVEDVTIKPVTEDDFHDWLSMALELWPDYEPEELRAILEGLIPDNKQEPFICRLADGSPAGFLDLSTRTDYVEGTETSPVGYVEGIFVKEELRGTGIGRKLVEFAERWASDKGYTQLASDAELDNTDSHEFHKSVGFDEAGRIVAFVKNLVKKPG
jgi:aminoglycoside 6'-N-acetyltransferase I